MNKYTKGLWVVKDTTELPEIWADDTIIVGMPDYDIGGVCTSMADAHLIAAAPRLFEALDTLVEAIALEGEIPHYNTVIKDCINLAQAALAAARG